MNILRAALCQINTTVGDFKGNRDRIIDYIEKARKAEADVAVFPELCITGYPPEDLVLRTDFINANLEALEQVAAASKNIAVVVGFVERHEQVYNSAAFIYDGRIYGIYRKMFLPNYGVFDEKRHFSAGQQASTFTFGDTVFGVNICEDIWYPNGPAALQTEAGAGIILNLNASPYQTGKWKFRERMISTRASDNAAYVLYVNAVGGQDELIYEGGSIVLDPTGEKIARGKFFEEDLILVDLEPELPFRTRLHDLRLRERMSIPGLDSMVSNYVIPVPDKPRKKTFFPSAQLAFSPPVDEEIYKALVLGVRDYVIKNGFKQVVIGISGGIDSALVAAIAVDALGQDNVTGIFMPSKYTSDISRDDSFKLAENLGFKLLSIPIDDMFVQYEKALNPWFKGLEEDVTEQNIQARIRGNLLMAYSNKFGALVLTTGNKSEMAVGYATLYGDMAGGFAVIKDIPKTTVYEMANYRNASGEVIPQRIITRPPSAELKEDQQDTDSLPPYDILDPILKALIEEDRDLADIVSMGYDKDVVARVAKLVHISEYKRRQAPPGIKISPRAFGRDRRIPITNKF
ncbi:MAG: NAD+ synthase [Firmicutes bacterium]|nr:NAD+ synthase [Bacillota bacterium]